MAAEEIITFDDLMGLLERNPEHLARLRQSILDEEFRQLPAEVRAQAERFDAVTEEVRALAHRMDALTEQIRSLDQTVQSHTALLQSIVNSLETHARTLEHHSRMLESHSGQLGRHERQLNRLLGYEAERRFQRNAAGYFGHLLRRIRVVDPSTLADDIDDAIDAGVLTEGDRRSLMALDVVVRGLDRDTRQETRLAVEVSAGIGERDIMRAADRARLLKKLTGHTTLPVVAGYSVFSAYRQLAEDKGVEVTIVAPPDAGEPEETDEPDVA